MSKTKKEGLLVEEDLRKFAKYDPKDALVVFTKAAIAIRKKVTAKDPDVEDMVKRMETAKDNESFVSPLSILLPVLLAQEEIDEIQNIEKDLLESTKTNSGNGCTTCPTFVAGECGGIFKKGDLLLSLLSACLKLGIASYHEMVLQTLDPFSATTRTVNAEEFFNMATGERGPVLH